MSSPLAHSLHTITPKLSSHLPSISQAQTESSEAGLNPHQSNLRTESEASNAEISNLLIFQKPNEQLEGTQYKASELAKLSNIKKTCKLAAQKNPIKLQAKGSTATRI